MASLGTVAIVGVGLIGGSIGMSLRTRGLSRSVIGIGRDSNKLDEAMRLGAIDQFETDLPSGVRSADIVVICTPVGRIVHDALSTSRSAAANALITDAGSTKAGIVREIDLHPIASSQFVGAHPIAGSERSGVQAATPTLFHGRTCIITPTPKSSTNQLERARVFWESLGLYVKEMTPDEHDQILALTSHLPHVVASALSASVPSTLLEYAAGAYRDGTRVAASDGKLWADIFLANRECILESLDTFNHNLRSFRQALVDGKTAELARWWEQGRTQRNALEIE